MYDGTAKSVTVTTTPLNLDGVTVTYNGSASVPVNAGSYAVNATLTNTNFQATNATGTLIIAKADQTITFGSLPDRLVNDPPFTLSATASSGLAVSYGSTGTIAIAGSTVTITGTGSATITASQAGDTNHNAASSVTRAFAINNPVPSIIGITPTSGLAGSQGFTLTINGSNFVDGSTIQFNGVSRPASFISSIQLTGPNPGIRNCLCGNSKYHYQ